jgi:hypothetical protein
MLKIREWERFQFNIDFKHLQVVLVILILLKQIGLVVTIQIEFTFSYLKVQENSQKDDTRSTKIVNRQKY